MKASIQTITSQNDKQMYRRPLPLPLLLPFLLLSTCGDGGREVAELLVCEVSDRPEELPTVELDSRILGQIREHMIMKDSELML